MTGSAFLGIDPELSREDLATHAYLGGLVDGEGYIGAKRRLPGKNKMTAPKYSIACYLGMTDREPVDILARFAGAAHRVSARARSNPRHKTIYEFEVENDRAATLISRLVPFLVAKREQALIALKLFELRKESRANRTKPVASYTFKGGAFAGGTYRTFGLSDEFVSRCDELYLRLRRRPDADGARDVA